MLRDSCLDLAVILLCLISCSLAKPIADTYPPSLLSKLQEDATPVEVLVSKGTWSVMIKKKNGAGQSLGDPPRSLKSQKVWISFNPHVDSTATSRTRVREKVDNSESGPVFSDLLPWLSKVGTLATVPPIDSPEYSACPGRVNSNAKTMCQTYAECKPFYRCLFRTLKNARWQDFQNCFGPDPAAPLQCPIELINLEKVNVLNDRETPCDDTSYRLTAENWADAETDVLINLFVSGDLDGDRIYWPGRDDNLTLTEDLGRQFLAAEDYRCTLERPCATSFQCDEAGSHSVLQHGEEVLRSRSAYFVMKSVQNINQQLTNQNIAIKGALANLALDTFNIGDFFPRPDPQFGLRNALLGLGTVLAAIGGFIPVVGLVIAGSAALIAGAGGIIGNAISSGTDLMAGEKNFARGVQVIYGDIMTALTDATETLFAGGAVGSVDQRFFLGDMLQGGAWVNIDALTKFDELEEKLRLEILSRSVNALWKIPTSNKNWVTFFDLGDDPATMAKCLADGSGPQDSKVCADGGIYYVYNYVEDGNLIGHVDYPWGGDKIKEKLGIDLKWITEASAKSYRLAKRHGLDPFNMDGLTSTSLFLQEAVNGTASDLLDAAGHYPGSWTLPVCDISGYGAAWNWDYSRTNSMMKYEAHPPCLCGNNALGSPAYLIRAYYWTGPKGEETNPWQKAAGMLNFKTFHVKCTEILEHDFPWPEGLTEITYESKKPYTVKKLG